MSNIEDRTPNFFASDNSATVHPAVMEALAEANRGHSVAYGDDPWTRNAEEILKKIFGRKAEVFFVYNGTGANVIGIQAAVSSFHGVICTEASHINCDECGAVEKSIGCKLLPLQTRDAKMLPEQIIPLLEAKGVVHHSQPRIVSITQSTELGTVYDDDTVREIGRICRRNDMYLHMDGARICNAAASLNADLGDITAKLGVDILSLGATKNGIMFGEAIVVFNRDLAGNLGFVRKQGTQLASKMRYISAQFAALFGSDLWRENALHANQLARELADELRAIDRIEVVYPVEANGVFARFPREAIADIQEEFYFYEWDPGENIVRLMLSFDSTRADVEAFVKAVRRHV